MSSTLPPSEEPKAGAVELRRVSTPSDKPKADLDAQGEKHGYILDLDHYDEADRSKLKTAADGHTVLIPQPSDDPEDPLNWPQRKKNTVLVVITCISFLSDYASSQGIAALVPQITYVHTPVV